MIRVGLTFLTGRYHATPWDRHVNEGVVEWPPAPLRVLRALAAALLERCPAVPRERALNLLCKLAPLPRYTLPDRVNQGHTRHYLSKNELDRNATAMAFDTFVVLRRPGLREKPDVVLWWDVTLSGEERAILDQLARAVPYLGRAESWCQMRLLGDDEGVEAPNCEPCGPHGGSAMRLLCAAAEIQADQLLVSTNLIRQQGHTQAPGTRWVSYSFRSARGATAKTTDESRPQIVEFALGGGVLPLFTDAVRVGELFRRAALSLHVSGSSTLSGHQENGERVRVESGEHPHAHYIPECRDEHDRVTHVVVYAPAGFSPSEQAALQQLVYLPWHLYEETKRVEKIPWKPDVLQYVKRMPSPTERRSGGSGSLDVVLCGFWSRADYRGGSRLFGQSQCWRSGTPFVLPRHMDRRRAKDQPEAQILRELERRLGPEPVRGVEVVPINEIMVGDRRVDWWRFRRWRAGHSLTTGSQSFRLRFAEPVEGPLLLGYGNHFGLGQFLPE